MERNTEYPSDDRKVIKEFLVVQLTVNKIKHDCRTSHYNMESERRQNSFDLNNARHEVIWFISKFIFGQSGVCLKQIV